MKLLIDTSTPTCNLYIVDESGTTHVSFEAGRELAHNLLGWLEDQLAERGATWQDITGLGVMRGPGSFTGLRIGITVFNALADSLNAPIVGAMGDDWQAECTKRLAVGENDKIVLPFYNSDANITTPRK
ncbi:tRNA (adenosine(37)-N6)-threonylcarbamoyltransferase complex dimerization subunit type 1 TsaB [Candidatus Saccharibacteria bacterium]|jgi:tRNA threonylcarbamoyladenosine biosynthesis protein TsaB|nr:tRNA (adenosine(37)-N6)-threonylcarbamoyltransferase complex dimerization subunit type 1 TsaB [Candidatus Saccharibacteria bacterium]